MVSHKVTATKKMLTDKYNQVKFMLGRIPTILDFYKLGEIDPMLFINYAKTFDNFVRMVDKDYKIKFTETEEQILAFVSALIIDGKRPHELIMLEMIMDDMVINETTFSKELKRIGETYRQADFNSAKRMISMDFVAGSDSKKFGDIQNYSAPKTSFSKYISCMLENEKFEMASYAIKNWIGAYKEENIFEILVDKNEELAM